MREDDFLSHRPVGLLSPQIGKNNLEVNSGLFLISQNGYAIMVAEIFA